MSEVAPRNALERFVVSANWGESVAVMARLAAPWKYPPELPNASGPHEEMSVILRRSPLLSNRNPSMVPVMVIVRVSSLA